MFHQFTQILITRCLLKGGVHHGPGLGGDGVLEQGGGGDLLGYLLASGLLAALHHWMRFHQSHTVLLVRLAIQTLNNLVSAQLLLVEFHFLTTCKKLMIELKRKSGFVLQNMDLGERCDTNGEDDSSRDILNTGVQLG